jgi:hypothetical protein
VHADVPKFTSPPGEVKVTVDRTENCAVERQRVPWILFAMWGISRRGDGC